MEKEKKPKASKSAMLKREAPTATVQTPNEPNHSGRRARGEILSFPTVLSLYATLLNTSLKAKEGYRAKTQGNKRPIIPVNRNRLRTRTNSHG
jgi:hypothetical protein